MIPVIRVGACYIVRQIAAAARTGGIIRRNIRALIGRIRGIRRNGVCARILRGIWFFEPVSVFVFSLQPAEAKSMTAQSNSAANLFLGYMVSCPLTYVFWLCVTFTE